MWNHASKTIKDAKIGVTGYSDDNMFNISAEKSLRYILKRINIDIDYNVLEIGCGIGRIGKEISKICCHWTGLDASTKMISFAKDYLKDHHNVTLKESSGYDLHSIPNNSQDVVYCIVVFMHLDEWERFNYIKESYRVLKKGGVLLVNNINLCSKQGWKLFEEHCEIKPNERPLNISKTSTQSEIVEYFKQADFVDIKSDFENLWVAVSGSKSTL